MGLRYKNILWPYKQFKIFITNANKWQLQGRLLIELKFWISDVNLKLETLHCEYYISCWIKWQSFGSGFNLLYKWRFFGSEIARVAHGNEKIPNDRNDWHPRMLMSECINVNLIVISFSAFDTNVLGRNAYVLANQDSISISSDLF